MPAKESNKKGIIKVGKATSSFKYSSVLLIDDEEIDNFINERIIVSSSFAENVVVKKSAFSGLDYLKECLESGTQIPKLIFLDLNMPVMDGFGFLQEYETLIEKHPELGEKTKIIILSSSISPDDLSKASTNPRVAKYINKPLNPKYLEAINF